MPFRYFFDTGPGPAGPEQLHRINEEPCGVCGLDRCLPSHPHPRGTVYHVDMVRFVALDEVGANRGNGSHRLEPGLPEGFRSLKAYERELEDRQEEKRRKVRERVRRHRERRRLEGAGV
ncbi:hypothetical protein MYX19_01575 [Nitrospinae bacterium AH-259-F20]|nr:hypothetical protein [Nitrospinae bacterium AH-259-F20]